LDDSWTSLFHGGGDCNDHQSWLYFRIAVFYFRRFALEEFHPFLGENSSKGITLRVCCLPTSLCVKTTCVLTPSYLFPILLHVVSDSTFEASSAQVLCFVCELIERFDPVSVLNLYNLLYFTQWRMLIRRERS
jgi:hypothetical protein